MYRTDNSQKAISGGGSNNGSGSRFPRSPLYAASFNELDDIKIEISVLTPLQKINSTDEIEVGKHGIVMVRNSSMGLLLPQVATEYNWGATEFWNIAASKRAFPEKCGRTRKQRFISFLRTFFKGCI